MTDLPEWAMQKAAGITESRQSTMTTIVALALVEAEARGIDRAATHLEQMAKDTPLGHENVQRGRSTYNWLQYSADAIRKLMEQDSG